MVYNFWQLVNLYAPQLARFVKIISMRIHLIAIGGAVMHNLALALKQNGHQVSGSDDEIVDPARARLAANKLLPAYEGWNPDVNDNSSIELIILGMHARAQTTPNS
jgi:UDP-N-acetylmuramate: L-alanyl-gamma-D-glutamyl-meso-diaminopimelate ligase